MKRHAGIVVGFALLVLLVGCGEDIEDNEEEEITKAPAKQRVEIPDRNLRHFVEQALGKTSGATITAEDMATLQVFSLTDYVAGTTQPTEDLTGLEFATGLTELTIWTDRIADFTPLASLTQLEVLILKWTWGGSRPAPDLTFLTGLTRLKYLEIEGFPNQDFTPLEGLTNLTRLSLSNTNLTDLSPLAGLTNVTHLYLDNTSITDLSPLAGLVQLGWLQLRGNDITDITPLAGLTNLGYLGLEETNVTDFSPLVDLTELGQLRAFGLYWKHSTICDMHLEVDVPVKTEGFDCE